MAKLAIYEADARRNYVEEGLGLDSIVGLFEGKVSRKTLYNWKEQFEWDAKRKAFLDHNVDRKTQVIELENQLFNEVKANPTSKNIKRWLLLLVASDKYGGTPKIKDDSPDQKEKLDKLYSPELLDHIKHALYGLK
ncbi:MAG: hypothetical protein M0R70_12685 [Nitrospirae bacterium]|nr:hypothetical protein [Nitrospirota bacterium]